jgi:ATP-dependent DNA helicase RecG
MAKTGFDLRKLMERAIEVMRSSIPEPRDDGKASPVVGAVLRKRDGTVETGCRCELRDGDHAEYTLLERKNRDQKLDDALLFTTLEPCAPGSRRHPKLSCAERIVLARIKQVWVGIEDPDPTVDRKGIKYLQDKGVTVGMFDRDLQEEIQKANEAFIREALERAAAAEEKRKPEVVSLSRLEKPVAASATTDFSKDALEQYRDAAQIEDQIGSAAFERRLVRQGLLTQNNGQFTPTGFGILLFGKEPRTSLPQAGLLGTVHYPDGKEETRDFDGPLVLIPSLVERWLRDKLPAVLDRSHMQRHEIPPLSFEMVREAVVNALIHRDYEIREGKCQLVVTADTITVKSPGGPLPPITLEQLSSFNAPMLSRNPELHYVFAKIGMAEERGLGLKSLKSRAQGLRLPLPKYAWEDPYLVLTIFRNQEAVSSTLKLSVLESLSESERRGWQWLATTGRAKSSQYANAMRVEYRTARRHLNHFVELGLVRKSGSGPSTGYEVI